MKNVKRIFFDDEKGSFPDLPKFELEDGTILYAYFHHAHGVTTIGFSTKTEMEAQKQKQNTEKTSNGLFSWLKSA